MFLSTAGRRTVIDIAALGYEDAIPDGMTIDSRGDLWVALMFGGTVSIADIISLKFLRMHGWMYFGLFHAKTPETQRITEGTGSR